MTQRSLFFDSISADRPYAAADYAALIGALTKNNGVVYGYKDALAVTAASPAAMSVNVGLGAAFIQGYMLEVHTLAESLTVAAADATNPRIDRIVVRLNLAQVGRTVSLAVKTGTPAASPVAPILQQDATIWEISLAQVLVGAGATTITAANITDERSYVAHEHNGADMPKIDSANVKYASGVSGFTPATAAAALDALAGARIVEKGSNANGSYIRWENGFQICRHQMTGLGPINTSGGAGYISAPYSWTFPAAFLTAPSCAGDIHAPGRMGAIYLGNGGAGTTADGFYLWRATSDAGTDFTIGLMAVGWWK